MSGHGRPTSSWWCGRASIGGRRRANAAAVHDLAFENLDHREPRSSFPGGRIAGLLPRQGEPPISPPENASALAPGEEERRGVEELRCDLVVVSTALGDQELAALCRIARLTRAVQDFSPHEFTENPVGDRILYRSGARDRQRRNQIATDGENSLLVASFRRPYDRTPGPPVTSDEPCPGRDLTPSLTTRKSTTKSYRMGKGAKKRQLGMAPILSN